MIHFIKRPDDDTQLYCNILSISNVLLSRAQQELDFLFKRNFEKTIITKMKRSTITYFCRWWWAILVTRVGSWLWRGVLLQVPPPGRYQTEETGKGSRKKSVYSNGRVIKALPPPPLVGTFFSGKKVLFSLMAGSLTPPPPF